MIHFVDIETSGLDPVRHDVIEVGIVTAEYGQVVEEVEFSLPFASSNASPKALEVNGWGQREFAPLVPKDVGKFILDEILDEGLVAAWHAHFDFGFLAQFCQENGDGRVPWSHRAVIDLPSLVMGRLGVLTRGSTRDLMAQLRLPDDFEGRHTALADAYANFRVYEALRLYETAEAAPPANFRQGGA